MSGSASLPVRGWDTVNLTEWADGEGKDKGEESESNEIKCLLLMSAELLTSGTQVFALDARTNSIIYS